jgi:hypothetical protein
VRRLRARHKRTVKLRHQGPFTAAGSSVNWGLPDVLLLAVCQSSIMDIRIHTTGDQRQLDQTARNINPRSSVRVGDSDAHVVQGAGYEPQCPPRGHQTRARRFIPGVLRVGMAALKGPSEPLVRLPR